jgi:type II secretory pathway pseudopilin PulG
LCPSSSTTRPFAPAFTLLEIVLALSVFLIIIAGVFAIAKGAMEMSEDLTLTQERAMTRQNFIEFLRSSFRRVPGDAEFMLAVESQRGTYVPTLSVFNGGDAFSPGPALNPDTSVELYAEERPGGLLRVGLRLFDSQQTNALRLGTSKRRGPSKDDVVLPLLDNVARFELQFLDSGTGKWEKNWKTPVRPLFAQMFLTLDDGRETRNVFWIPPIVKRGLGGLPGGQPALGPDGQPLPPGTVPPGGNPSINPNVNPNAVNAPVLSK